MIRQIKRYLAIRSYMLYLSCELVRRFGKRSFYPVEQVTQAVQRGKLSAAFIAYAHASFCSQKDFDAYYEPLGVACSYQGLRRTIGQRYFSGRLDFDAKMILGRFGRPGRLNSHGEDVGDFSSGSQGDSSAIH